MTAWRDKIYWASRSQSFLWKFALGAIVLGVVAGALLSRVKPAGPGLLGDRVLAAAALRAQDDDTKEEAESPELLQAIPKLLAALEEELAAPSVQFRQLVDAIPTLAPYLGLVEPDQIRRIFRTRFPENQAVLAADYLAAWVAPASGAFARIEAAAAAAPQRYDRYILGRLELKRENHRAAYEQFRREAAAADAPESRYMAIRALAQTEDFAALAQLAAEPGYAPYFDANTRLRIATKQKDWKGILKWVPLSQLESYQDRVFLVSLVAGLAWAVFLLNLGEIPRLRSSRAALCLAGFLAGIASATPTVYAIVLQDDILKYHEGQNIYQALAYYIAGVGLREEVAKLLLFVPFLPILLKRDNELEALLVGSFVGLGFAVEENGGYFMLSEAASAPGRFLTANFFHVALTGMNGLALFRACARIRGGLNQFMYVLPMTIVAHGVYDALIDARDVDGGDFWAMLVYVLFCQQYFAALHPLRSGGRRTVSLTGSFVFGVSILCAMVIAFQMATLGAKAGATLIFLELLGSASLLFLFFKETREPLGP